MPDLDLPLLGRVRSRAGNRCEYCRMSQLIQGARFHIEHVVPRSRGGDTVEDNLALACPSCNLHKGSAIEGRDPGTGATVRLFNPRTDLWAEHFEVAGSRIEGHTEIGRATILLLRFNDPRRVIIRELEARLGISSPNPPVS